MKTNLLPVLALLMLLGSNARATPIEDLLNDRRYAEFTASANAQAANGDVDALFLLGKSYHLGLGVEKDLDAAQRFYAQARERGSARASHNLGLLALDANDKAQAILLLEEALSRGLKMPTLRNLGRAYTPPESSITPYELASTILNARKGGDAYAQAWAIKPDADTETQAARLYLTAWQFARSRRPVPPESVANPLEGEPRSGLTGADLELPALRARTMEWLQRGMARNEGVAWTNYGVLLLLEEAYPEARAALLKGAGLGVAAAHYQLAEMAQRGSGGRAIDPEEAARQYEQAALLGLAPARPLARDLIGRQLGYTDDITRLREGIKRLEALQEPDVTARRVEGHEKIARTRLAWAEAMIERQQNPRTLPRLPVFLHACELGWSEKFGRALNAGANSTWWLVVSTGTGLRRAERLPLEGRIDAQGCATLSMPLPPNVRDLLDSGAVVALALQSSHHALAWHPQKNRIVLSLADPLIRLP